MSKNEACIGTVGNENSLEKRKDGGVRALTDQERSELRLDMIASSIWAKEELKRRKGKRAAEVGPLNKEEML